MNILIIALILCVTWALIVYKLVFEDKSDSNSDKKNSPDASNETKTLDTQPRERVEEFGKIDDDGYKIVQVRIKASIPTSKIKFNQHPLYDSVEIKTQEELAKNDNNNTSSETSNSNPTESEEEKNKMGNFDRVEDLEF